MNYALFFCNKGQATKVRECATLAEANTLENDFNTGLWLLYTEPDDFVHYEPRERTTQGWVPIQPQQQLLN